MVHNKISDYSLVYFVGNGMTNSRRIIVTKMFCPFSMYDKIIKF